MTSLLARGLALHAHSLLVGILLTTSGLSLAAPILTGISPASGETAGSTLITLTGIDFGAAPSVTIGGQPAAVQEQGASTTSIVVSSPAGQGVNRQVILINGGSSSNALSFDYLPPAISGISPGTGSTQGGTTLTLTGTNFGLSATVLVGSSSAPITSMSHTQITCILPAGQGQNVPVTVTTGGQRSNTFPISYNAPIVSSISPSSGPILGGTTVTVNGTNFGLSPVVIFDGVAMATTPDPSTPHVRVRFTTPAGTGTGRKVAVLVGGQLSNSQSFSYDGPVITGLGPTTGPSAGGTAITLTGSNFGTSPIVTIGGAVAFLTLVSDSSLSVTLPPGQGANREVRITNSERQAATAFFSYTAPVIESVNPPSAPSSGNVSITIAGQNLGISPTVTLGGLPVSVVFSTQTQIVFIAPPSFAGGTNLPVVVTAGNQTSNTGTFSYVLPVLTDTTDTDSDGLNDATERQLSMYGFDRLVAQPSLVSSFLTGNTLYNPTQYAANRTAGQNDVTSAPNAYSLYTLSQVQALHVGAPLLQRNGLGQFKVTLGIEKSTTLQPTSFQPFPITAPQTSVNGSGQLEFLFTVPDNAAFFRVQAQ